MTKDELKLVSLKYLASYETAKLANKYLIFKSPKKSKDGVVGKPIVTVRIKLPKSDLSGKSYATKTIEYSGTSPYDFLNLIRKERDDLFKSVFKKSYTSKNVAEVSVRKPRESATGYEGVGVKKAQLKFVVGYTLLGDQKLMYFDILKYDSVERAYVAACRFCDDVNGRKIKSDSVYIKTMKTDIFPSFDVDFLRKQLETLEKIKATAKIAKDGIEVVAKLGQIGFFANFFDKVHRRQHRNFFNASQLGENESFLMACRAKDEINGKPVKSDEDYLKLKQDGIFTNIL